MKEFSKYVLATIVGIVATVIIFLVLALMSIMGLVASSEATKNVPSNSVLSINLTGIISEQSSEDIFSQLTGSGLQQTGLNDILAAIKKAKTNDNIKGIYIEAGLLQSGYSSLVEIRNSLLDFKKSKKWIIAYGDIYTQGAYYAASAADKIYINPNGELDIHGLSTQTIYVKDLYAKLGIKHQIIKVGKYKSATETYSETKMSDANREQITAFTSGVWNKLSNDIAESRKISTVDIDECADSLTAMMNTDELKKRKLIDGVMYHDEVKAEVKKLLGLKVDDYISQLSVSDMRNVKEDKKTGDKIAVYYAYGVIVDTPLQGIMNMQEHQIVGNDMCKDLEEIMNDDDVKSVVIRVNSPGGSAFASEQIWHQVAKLKEKKPVVISMGDYAASGGYYISCNASWIVAQPTTLTGSIGIYGVIPEASELFNEKLGLHFDGVKTNKHSDMTANMYGLPVRPFRPEETAMLQRYVERGYSLFRKRVADGRKKDVQAIEQIAQGHVWLGSDALGINLVDQLGGLDDAIVKAAKLAKLGDYYTQEYPAPLSWKEQLFDFGSNSDNYLNDRMQAILGDWYMPFVTLKSATQRSPIQASMPYIIQFN